MLELIFVWAEAYRNLKHVGFTFSESLQVTFEHNEQVGTRVLQIHKNEDSTFRFWGNKVSQVTALVGENGSGKTNLLDLLGLTYVDRVREGLHKGEPIQKYIIVYQISNDLFAVEGIGLETIRNSIVGINIGSGTKECYSFLVSRSDGKLYFKDNLQESAMNVMNRISLLNIRNIFRNGYTRGKHGSNNDLYMFERLILSPKLIGNLEKYMLLIEIKNQIDRKTEERLIAYDTEIYLKIKVDPPSYENKLNLKTSRYFFQLEMDINKSKMQIPKKRRMAFINTFLESFIQHEFEEVISHYAEDQDLERAEKRKDIQEIVTEIELSIDDFREYYLSVLEVIEDHNESISNEYEEVIDELLVRLNQIDDNYFDNNSIMVNISNMRDESLVSLLGHLDTSNNFSSIVNIDFGPTSSGEEAIINILAAIKDGIKRLSSSGSDKIIILLDEPDLFMHPEWSRKLLLVLLNYLNIYTLERVEYQLVISTHSPFFISDLPKERIIALEKSKETGECIVKEFYAAQQTFAGNIHNLLAEEFFMKATIGEFARLKITQVIKELSEKDLTIPENRKMEIKYIIGIIGEPVLRKKLNKLFQDRFFEKDVDWQTKRISQLEREIALLGNRDDLRNILDLLDQKIKVIKGQV